MIKFKFGAYDYNRTTGIVNALAEQVHTETTLFTAKERGKRFKFSRPSSGYRFAAFTVVDKRVYGFLKHTLFVSDDNVGRTEFHKFAQTVVTVDNAPV